MAVRNDPNTYPTFLTVTDTLAKCGFYSWIGVDYCGQSCDAPGEAFGQFEVDALPLRFDNSQTLRSSKCVIGEFAVVLLFDLTVLFMPT